jgi:hypothetical protein
MAGYKSISAGIQAMGERIDRLWALVSQPAKKNPKESKS